MSKKYHVYIGRKIAFSTSRKSSAKEVAEFYWRFYQAFKKFDKDFVRIERHD